MSVYDLSSSYSDPSQGFIAESRKTLAGCMTRIEHAAGQLSDADIWWRPHEAMNAVGNIMLHLRGNVGQWILAGVGGLDVKRNRPAEFSHREPIAGAELLAMLRETANTADDVIAGLTAETLTTACHIQGFDTTVIAAIFHAVSHFEGHAQEIIYIARLRRGDAYRFLWEPKNPAQQSAS